MKYKGEKCAACGEVFTEDDDVVVCPDCGSPHHRACYKENNQCANIAFHESGQKWHKALVDPASFQDSSEIVPCPSCRFPNPKSADKCIRCGADMSPKEEKTEEAAPEKDTTSNEDPFVQYMENELDAVRPYLGFDPEEDMGGATLKEVSQFVCTNTLYYIPIFKRMKDFGSKISFNISCLLFPYFYFANRKMWGWAMISAVLSIVLNMPTYILWLSKHIASNSSTEGFLSMIYDNQSSLENLDGIFSVFSTFASIGFCLFGNWLYYRYTMKTLRRMKSQIGGDKVPAKQLMTAGGVKPVNILFMALIIMGLGLAVLFASIQIMDAGKLISSL